MRAAGKCCGFCLLLLLPSQLEAVTGQSITILPAATVTWEDLLKLEQSLPPADSHRPQIAPLMPWPGPREVVTKNIGLLAPQPSTQERVATAVPDATQATPLIISFSAVRDNGWLPPDTQGAVGPNHIMTTLNGTVRILNKTGGVVSNASMENFWSSVGPFSPGGGFGAIFDPRTLYDPGSGRWLATGVCDPAQATASILFAISSGSDPTGSWTFYRIDADPGNTHWADFPDIGTNSTWVALTANMFPNVSGSVGPAMWVIDKSTALAGGPLTLTWFPMGFDVVAGFVGFSLRPCLTFGTEPKLYLLDNSGWTSGGTAMIRVSEITGTGPAPVWSPTPGSVFSGSGMFLVANNFNYGQIGASQADTNILIETIYPVIMNAVYRNGRIWCTHNAGLPASGPVDRTAVFWYQLDPTAMPNPIVQSGVVDGGPGVHYWVPSITANRSDDVMLGFSRSDTTRHPEGVYTTRRGTDPLGTMDPISVLKLGEGTYTKGFGGRIRWGDYSASVVDPADDSCLWTIQEYAWTFNRWGTWWGKICPGCIAKAGEVNGTPPIALPDVIHLVNYVFDQDRPATSCLGTDPGNCWTPVPLCGGEVNGISPVALPDVIHLVNYVFDKDRPTTGCFGSSPGNCWTPVASDVCCVPVP